MTKEQREQLRAMCKAATPGKWYDAKNMVFVSNPYGHGSMRIADIRGWGHLTGHGAANLSADEAIEIQHANAAVIVAAINALPGLLDELDDMETKADELKREVELYKNMYLKAASDKSDVDARAEALERALRGDCCYCDHEACKIPCGCINGNGWRFANKEDDTL